MEQVIFKELLFRNVRCHDEFQLSFHKNTLTLISGKNGSGKTSVFQAFYAGLYGETAEGIKIADLVHKQKKKNLEIIIPFKVVRDKGETNYEIRKYYAHKKFGSTVRLIEFVGKKEKDISGKTVTDTHKLIEKIILPKEVFKNTVYFSQQVKDFFTALKDSDQKKIFDAIFNLGDFPVYYSQLSEKLKSQKDQCGILDGQRISNVHEQSAKVEIIKNLQELAERSGREKEEKIRDYQNKIGDMTKEATILYTQKTNLNWDEQVYNCLVSELEVERINLNNIESVFEKEKNQVEQDCKNTVEKLRLKSQNIFSSKQFEITEQASESIEEINSLNAKLAKLHDYSGHETLLQKKEEEIAIFEKKRLPLVEKHNKIKTELEVVRHDRDRLEKEFKEEKEKLRKIREEEDPICPYCGQKMQGDSKKTTDSCITQKLLQFKGEYTEESIKVRSLVDLSTQLLYELDGCKTERDMSLKEFDLKIGKIEKDLEIRKVEVEDQSLEYTRIIEAYQEERDNKIKKLKVEIQKDTDHGEEEHNIKMELFVKELQESLVVKKKVLEDNINGVTEKLKELKQTKEIFDKISVSISSTTALIDAKTIELEEIKQFQVDTKQLKEEEINLEQLISKQEDIKQQLISLEEIVEILEFWKEAFSDRGIKSMLIDDAIPELNKHVREELEKVAPGKFIVSFDTLSATKAGDIREKFAVNVLNTENGADKHSLLSGGEKRLIDVCIMRALRVLTEDLYDRKINILLLDEVLDSLDTDNSSLFCSVLKKLSKDISIMLVTHNKQIDIEYDEIYNL